MTNIELKSQAKHYNFPPLGLTEQITLTNMPEITVAYTRKSKQPAHTPQLRNEQPTGNDKHGAKISGKTVLSSLTTLPTET